MPNAADLWQHQFEKSDKDVKPPVRERLGLDREVRDPLVPLNPISFDASKQEDDISTMSNAGLIKEITRDPFKVTELIHARPTIVGELIQQSLHDGHSGAAQLLLGGLKAGYSNGTTAQRELLFRAVMRAEGPGAKAARDVIRELAKRETAGAGAPKIPGVPRRELKDPRVTALDAAERDPASAKFRANFFDRPDETANQLLEEANKDPSAFRKHADALTELIASSPEAAKRVASSVMRLRGPKARAVNLWLLGKAYRAMDGDIHLMDHGTLGKRDIPRQRVERIAPLLAQLASQPDNARELVAMSRQGETIADSGVGLQAVLARALDEHWSFSTRKAVQHSINEGAAHLLHDSLDPKVEHRRAEVMDAARFIGEAACAEKRHMKSSTTELIGQRLAQVGPLIVDRIPGADAIPLIDKGVEYGAGKLKEASTPKPKWSGRSTEDLMREIYKTVKPKPQGVEPGSPERDKWHAEFTEWSSDGQDQWDLTEKRCSNGD